MADVSILDINGSQWDFKDSTARDVLSRTNTYSTTEVKTGKSWIDGKPIYRKVVPIMINSQLAPDVTFSGTDRFNYSKNYTHNAETITLVRGIAHRQSGEWSSYEEGGQQVYIIWCSPNQMALRSSTTLKDFYVITEYTKTTD